MTSGHLAIFLGSVIHGALIVAWQAFKKRQSKKPVTMKLRKGVYVPWGPVEKFQRFLKLGIGVYAAWLVTLAGLLLWTWLVGPVFN